MAAYDRFALSDDNDDTDVTKLSYSLDACAFDDYEEDYFVVKDETWKVPRYNMAIADVEGEDSGWISDDCAPVQLPPEGTNPQHLSGQKPYMDYDDDVWVDEAKGTYNTYKTSDPSKLMEILREMFNGHSDVYSLLLVFLTRTGKVRLQKNSLPRIVLTEFKNWLGEHKNKPKNAVLTPSHRKGALQILIKCHSVLMDDMTAIFELHSVDKTEQLDLIDSLLTEDRLKEAVTYAWKFSLQEHFEMSTMLLPLIALDKIGIVEDYIDGSVKLQEEFVGMLDDLCEPGTTQAKINSFLSNCTLGPKSLNRDVLSHTNCKLNFKQLYRLAHRMVQKYNLDLFKFSHVYSRHSSGSLHHLLQNRYLEGSITAENLDDLLESMVGDSASLQMQLVKELVHFNDTAMAAKWAVKYALPVDQLPYCVQIHLDTQTVDKIQPKASNKAPAKRRDFYTLQLPLSSVLFVARQPEFDRCWDTIKQPNVIIGIDAEWKLPSCNRGIERLAVLQLAMEDEVYLLDMVGLPRVIGEIVLRQFLTSLLHSQHSLKLGYGIQADLSMLRKSWPFAKDIVASPVRVLDLQRLEEMVNALKAPRQVTTLSAPVRELPVHPLLKGHTPISHDRSHDPTNSSLQNGIKSHDTLHPSDKITNKLPKHPLLEKLAVPKIDQTSLQGGTGTGDNSVRRGGLANLVERCFGKPLDKLQQLSDWEKRPLTSEQITYAALDAHCLLGVYKHLMSEAVTFDLSFNVKPALISDQ